jgi:hypothetical protein
MKRYILPAAIAALSMLSCQKELADPAQPDQAPASGELTEMTFSATVEENDTKTYIDATDGFKAFWETTDEIALYADGTKADASFTVKEGTAPETTADFTGTVVSDASAYYAVYPASAAGECSEGKVTVTVPAVQTLSGHTTASGALVSVAKAAGAALPFKNVTALLKVNVSVDDITEIVLQGKNDEVIAGTVKVDAATGVLSEVVAGSKMITFKPEGETFATGDYYIALLPTDFTKGFDLVLSRSEDAKRSIKETANQLTLARSAGKNLGTVTADYAYEWVNVIMNKADIDLFSAAHVAATTETWVLGTDVDYQSGTYPAPGNGNYFKGIFDGRNHRIYNLKIAGSHAANNLNTGFFNETENATIKNLVFGSKDGKTYDGVSVISNYTARTAGFEYVGLIARARGTTTITNVVNFSKVTVTSDNKSMARVGGICGYLHDKSSISNCVNYGEVSNNSTGADMDNNLDASMTGGVVGNIQTSVKAISGCHNYGKVYSNDMNNHFIGGVFGITVNTIEMTDCDNYGEVMEENGTAACQCEAGGVVGRLNAASSKMTGCDNHGTVTVKNRKSNVLQGGVVGLIKNTATIDNCTNDAALTQELPTSAKYHALGGIVGFHDAGTNAGTVQNCSTTTKSSLSATYTAVNSECGVGGIIGIAGVTTMKNNVNNGTVQGSNTTTTKSLYVGGITGWDFSKSCPEVTNNTNNGSISGTCSNIVGVGGICGTSISPISNCYNFGAITGTATNSARVGTIAGITNNATSNCQSAGSVNGTAVTAETANTMAVGSGTAATGCYFAK